ncbi:MAG: gamma-glutamyltransferase [Pseudomonadota bacterium]
MSATAGVAAGHPLTAQAAADVLHAGGNAFDASIAAVATACVCEPVLASLGGGGFLTAMTADGELRSYDFFVHTPRNKNPQGESFYPVEVNFGDATQAFHIGLGASATPGLVKGLFEVHRDLGRAPLSELFQPAVAHARAGVALNDYQAYLLGVVAPIYRDTAGARALFCGDARSEALLQKGDRLTFDEMGDLLEVLAIEGPDLFYRGEVAAAVVEQCRSEGGHLVRDDLASYDVVRRKPILTMYRDHQFAATPVPSSGGVLIAFALQLLEATGLRHTSRESAGHLLTLAQAMQLTGRARLRCAPESPDDILNLLDPDLLGTYQAECAERSAALRGTTHISVIDRDGNHAAVTVSNGEGNGHIVPGAGFMLNNMLGEEDLNPAGFGAWTCDERMTSMMAPAILRASSGQSWALGSGGSNRIRSALLQVISNLVDFDLPIDVAIGAPRLHLENEHLSIESGFDDAVVHQLAEHFPNPTVFAEHNMFFGGVHAVTRSSRGDIGGAGDKRRGGCFTPI